jgi:hypothetical protein
VPRTFRALPALLLVVVAGGACLDVGLPQTLQVGFLSQPTHSDGGTGYVMVPEATFYANVNLAANVPPADSCFLAPIVPAGGQQTTLPTLDAGPVVFTRIGGREDSLRPAVGAGMITYRPASGVRIPFVPGDSIEVTVPGAAIGFPTAMMKTRTAEAFTHDPIVVPASASDITVSWTPAAPVSGSRMAVSLRYANAQSTGEVNEQIYCGFIDDGSGTVPAALTTGWINSLDGRRATRVTRFRAHEVIAGGGPNTRFTYISTFTLPLPAIPPGF